MLLNRTSVLTIIHSFSEINWRQKLNCLYRRSSMNYRWPYSVCKNTPLLSCYRHELKRKVRIGDRCTERGWLGARVSSISWYWAAKTFLRGLSSTSDTNVLYHHPGTHRCWWQVWDICEWWQHQFSVDQNTKQTCISETVWVLDELCWRCHTYGIV